MSIWIDYSKFLTAALNFKWYHAHACIRLPRLQRANRDRGRFISIVKSTLWDHTHLPFPICKAPVLRHQNTISPLTPVWSQREGKKRNAFQWHSLNIFKHLPVAIFQVVGPRSSTSNEPLLAPALSGLLVVLLLSPISFIEKLGEVRRPWSVMDTHATCYFFIRTWKWILVQTLNMRVVLCACTCPCYFHSSKGRTRGPKSRCMHTLTNSHARTYGRARTWHVRTWHVRTYGRARTYTYAHDTIQTMFAICRLGGWAS